MARRASRTVFVASRYPSKHSEHKGERKLGKWVRAQRRCAFLDLGVTVGKAKQFLLHSVDGWSSWVHDAGQRNMPLNISNDTSRCSNRWAVMFEEVEAWFLDKKEWPKQASEDSQEKVLGQWLNNNRKSAKQGKHDEFRASVWSISGMNVSTWQKHFEEAEAWFQSHVGATPRQVCQDTTEQGIARWIHNQKARIQRKKLSRAQCDKLSAAAWWGGPDPWERSLGRTAQWYTAHPGREPSQLSSESAEKQAAKFVMNQRQQQEQLAAKQLKKLRSTSWWKPQIYKRPAKQVGPSKSRSPGIVKRPAGTAKFRK